MNGPVTAKAATLSTAGSAEGGAHLALRLEPMRRRKYPWRPATEMKEAGNHVGETGPGIATYSQPVRERQRHGAPPGSASGDRAPAEARCSFSGARTDRCVLAGLSIRPRWRAARGARESGARHTGVSVRGHESRHDDAASDGDGEFAEQHAHHTRPSAHRDEHGPQGKVIAHDGGKPSSREPLSAFEGV